MADDAGTAATSTTVSSGAAGAGSGAGGAGAGAGAGSSAPPAPVAGAVTSGTREWDEKLIRRTIQIASDARTHGNHPFGALLADEHGNIIMEFENHVVTDKDVTAHAETGLVRKASKTLPDATEKFPGLTLYTSCEPCAMCAGAVYWAGIGRVVYGLSEEKLYSMTGSHEENPVFAHGQRKVEVTGPVCEEEAAAVHEGFW